MDLTKKDNMGPGKYDIKANSLNANRITIGGKQNEEKSLELPGPG